MNGHLPGRRGTQNEHCPGRIALWPGSRGRPSPRAAEFRNHRRTTTGWPPRTSDPLSVAVREPTPG
jgi:hypothetical protein